MFDMESMMKDADDAFDEFVNSFNKLAKLEDVQTTLTSDLKEYQEGSRKAEQTTKKMRDLQPKLTAGQRALRLSAIEVDRRRMKVDIMNVATIMEVLLKVAVLENRVVAMEEKMAMGRS